MLPNLASGTHQSLHTSSVGDLNNVSAMHATEKPIRDPPYACRSLSIPVESDHSDLRRRYRPFLLDERTQATDWVSRLELSTVTKMAEEEIKKTGQRLQILVLYGSLRERY